MKIRSILLKAFLLIMCLMMLLTGCDGSDPLDASNDASVTDAVSESVAESETKKSNIPPVTADRDYIKYKNLWETGITVEDTIDGKPITLRRVEIDIAGDGEAIKVYQITDIHFNYLNAADQNDSAIVASSQAWKGIGDNAPIVETFKRCVAYAGDNQIVATGDLANFYSNGNMELIERYIFDPTKNIMAVGGNHDATLAGYNTNRLKANIASLETLFAKYNQDLSYFSKVLDNRVMLIQMDNATACDLGSPRFTEEQADKLEADLATARSKGYTVLLFYHIPMPSQSADSMENYDLGMYKSGASKEVYNIITNNADIIKGCFAGHTHADSYSELAAKTADGKKALIPQYVLKAMYTGTGDMIEIVLK